jgi:hypothetical protein
MILFNKLSTSTLNGYCAPWDAQIRGHENSGDGGKRKGEERRQRKIVAEAV